MTVTAVAPAEAGVQVGDFFVCSWGYDQTNVDFYKVVGLTAKGVKIQKWSSATVSDNGPTTYVTAGGAPAMRRWMVRDEEGRPVWDEEGHIKYEVETAPVLTKRLSSYGEGSLYVRISDYASAHKWEGQPQYETGSGYGH